MKVVVDLAPFLDRERQGMRVWRRALNQVLAERAPDEAPGIPSSGESLLESVNAFAASLPASHPLRVAREDIVEYVRTHPDAESFRAILGVSDAWLDQLFRDAMALEASDNS